MAKVKGPMFSTFASGSIWDQITYSPRWDHNETVVQFKKRKTGFTSEYMKKNSEIFVNKRRRWVNGIKEITEELKEE